MHWKVSIFCLRFSIAPGRKQHSTALDLHAFPLASPSQVPWGWGYVSTENHSVRQRCTAARHSTTHGQGNGKERVPESGLLRADQLLQQTCTGIKNLDYPQANLRSEELTLGLVPSWQESFISGHL